MSAFSFTAPHLSAEDEQREQEELTEIERHAIHQDVYGDHDAPLPPDQFDRETPDRALALFREAIDSASPDQRSAYREACERCPDLVETESNPRHFLQCENFDAPLAAKRVLLYWDLRRALFGSERAFLPMTLEEAMKDDILSLRQGFILMTPCDANGRPIVYFDRIRASKKVAPRDAVSRCLFYVLHVASSRSNGSRIGYVILANFRGYDLYQHSDRMIKKRFASTLKCMPARCRALHLCIGPGNVVLEFVAPVLKYILGRDARLRLQFHSETGRQLVDKLRPFGMSQEHVSAVHGGELGDRTRGEIWLAEQQQLEQVAHGESEKKCASPNPQQPPPEE